MFVKNLYIYYGNIQKLVLTLAKKPISYGRKNAK